MGSRKEERKAGTRTGEEQRIGIECVRRVNDRKAGALGCYPLRRERKVYRGYTSYRKRWLYREPWAREEERTREAFDRENTSVDLLSHPVRRSFSVSLSLALLYRAHRRGSIRTTWCNSNATENDQPNPRACNNLKPKPTNTSGTRTPFDPGLTFFVATFFDFFSRPSGAYVLVKARR